MGQPEILCMIQQGSTKHHTYSTSKNKNKNEPVSNKPLTLSTTLQEISGLEKMNETMKQTTAKSRMRDILQDR